LASEFSTQPSTTQRRGILRVEPSHQAHSTNQKKAYRPIISQSFLQELARSLTDLLVPSHTPSLLASDAQVLLDVLELSHPNVEEAKDLLDWSHKDRGTTKPVGVPKPTSVAALVATPQGYKVHDPHVEYMMARANSLPKGTELPLQTTYSRQAEEFSRLVRHLRQKFSPLRIPLLQHITRNTRDTVSSTDC
jgi:hypothetical protein